jgi:hypothetical protein
MDANGTVTLTERLSSEQKHKYGGRRYSFPAWRHDCEDESQHLNKFGDAQVLHSYPLDPR